MINSKAKLSPEIFNKGIEKNPFRIFRMKIFGKCPRIKNEIDFFVKQISAENRGRQRKEQYPQADSAFIKEKLRERTRP